MNTNATEKYLARFYSVINYIDTHPNENLNLEQLSNIAAFSKYHFHRQFTGYFGISVYKYIQLNHLKRATYQLAFRDDKIIDIALLNGYESPEAFARAFKKIFGQSPSAFRKALHWTPWSFIYQPLKKLRNMMPFKIKPEQVTIISFNEIQVATLEHRGSPYLIGNSIRKFIEWRKQNNLSPNVSATFNIAYDDPIETEPNDYRFDLCTVSHQPIEKNSLGIVSKVIPSGRCATLRHIGSDDNLRKSVSYLYSIWLPQSGEELRDFPLYFQRVKFFPEVSESQAITDIFLPLK